MTVWKIEPAELIWDDQNLPRSTVFNDLYFSAENGLEETRHVFLQGNRLEQRWKQLKDKDSFVICETGFGSGLNLLAAAQLWQKTTTKSAQLHFISTELHPMRKEDLRRTLSHWPELNGLAEKLYGLYPNLTPGFHRFELDENISVTLIFDEVTSALSDLAPTLATELWDYQSWDVDAWFLDGFAPAQNPDMWNERLFPLINRLSALNATAATFTSAGIVKRGLKEWGFEIEKVPGYGRKREMLVAARNPGRKADLTSLKQPHRPSGIDTKSSHCWHLDAEQPAKPESVAIIGAGIAGCTLAEALSRRHIQTTVFDKETPAYGASGNPQAALYARLSPDNGDLEDFCLLALNYASSYYEKRINRPELGDLCGLIQLARNQHEATKMGRIAERFPDARTFCRQAPADEISVLSGMKLTDQGLYFQQSGWINGPAFCQLLLEQPLIKTAFGQAITKVSAGQGQFKLFAGEAALGTFDAVVFCTAMETKLFPEANWLPLRPIRGQISFLENQMNTQTLRTVLCRETYLTPSYEGKQSIGATYELDTHSTQVKIEDHDQNLKELQALLALDKSLDLDASMLKGRASTRTTTPDYLPVVGSLPSIDDFLEQYQVWQKDRKRAIPEAHQGHTGLYLNIGYGSRGYTYAPLCAELLASKITREPAPVSSTMQRSLHPARFLVRSLARNRPLGL